MVGNPDWERQANRRERRTLFAIDRDVPGAASGERLPSPPTPPLPQPQSSQACHEIQFGWLGVPLTEVEDKGLGNLLSTLPRPGGKRAN